MKKTVSLLFLVILLTACQPAAMPQPTVVPSAAGAEPTPTSAAVEAPVGSMTDLVGTWWFPQAPGIVTEFKPDGTFRSWLSIDPSGIEAEGTYAVEAGKLTWLTSHPKCSDQPATYSAYVTTQAGERIQLRLQVVGTDPCTDRALALKAGIGRFKNP